MDPLTGMKIPSALQPLLDKASSETADLLRLLKPGQMLRASVIANMANGLARLRIGNVQLNARTPVPLEAGQRLLLQVEKGLPEPLLRVAREAAHESPAQRLRQHAMARQIPPREVARQLQEIQQQVKQFPATSMQRMPLVGRTIKALTSPAPELTKLSADVIRRAVRDSGLLLEPLLYRDKSTSITDQKLQLLQLLRLLKPENRTTPSATGAPENNPDKASQAPQTDQLLNRLMRLVEGGIARIQHHQAQSLASQDEPNRLVWQFDLPLRVGDQQDHLELKVQQEESNDPSAEAGATWRVEVRFEFEELGQVFSRITLQGKKLHCAFWSDRANTANRFEQSLPRLQKTLQAAGLEVSAVSSLHGSPQVDEGPKNSLLDERA